jgi:hypothetical protein
VRSISEADMSWAFWWISVGRCCADEFINAASYADGGVGARRGRPPAAGQRC